MTCYTKLYFGGCGGLYQLSDLFFTIGIGFTTIGQHRLEGENLPLPDDMNGSDRWASLRAVQIKARIKGYFFPIKSPLTTLLASVFAENNPNNEVYFGLGFNYF